MDSHINYDHDPEVDAEYAIVNILHGAAEILYGIRRWVLANAHVVEERADELRRERSQEGTGVPDRRRPGAGDRRRPGRAQGGP